MSAEGALSADFFARPVLEVAPALLGAVVRHAASAGTVAVRLTEVEAYAGERDPGSHAYRGRTPRTEVMFGPPGRVYVYFTYGMHWCMNLVCGPDGEASAVLLRAGEVVEGVDLAASRRTTAKARRDLARGPARLTGALGVDGGHNGADSTCAGCLTLSAGPAVPAVPAGRVATGPRVGVSGAGAGYPWRFWLEDEPSVSAYRRAIPRRGATRSSGRLGR